LLYRRIAAIFIKKKIKINDELSINKVFKTIKILSLRKHSSLRSEQIGNKASIIATKKNVRQFINHQQRLIVSKQFKQFRGCVIDGRDIGSKVFKNAQIKLFIDVDIEIRAKRRHKQLIEQGEKFIYSKILKDLKLRDKLDKNRKISPLVIPPNAIIINNSKTFRFTCNQINSLLNKVTRLT